MKSSHIIFILILLLICTLGLNVVDALKGIMRDRSNQRDLESRMVYEGRIPYIVFPSQAKMCDVFAQSYQQTISKLYSIKPSETPIAASEIWNRTIDVMNEMSELCTIELTDEAFQSHRSSIHQKYQR